VGDYNQSVYMMIQEQGWHVQLGVGEETELLLCPELHCGEFKEADQRILVAVRHYCKTVRPGNGSVIVMCEDTDVSVALVSLVERLVPNRETHRLYVLRGAKKLRLYDVETAVDVMDTQVEGAHSLLLPVHILTGCDTTSAFYKRGKGSALKTLKRVISNVESGWKMRDALRCAGTAAALSEFNEGDAAVLHPDFVVGMEEFVCAMYGCKASTLNGARKEMWFKCRAHPALLAPTSCACRLHLLRVCFQMELWERAVRYSNDPDTYTPMAHVPEQFGWDKECQPIWLDSAATRDAILNIVHCKTCKTGCTEARCTCKKNGLNCTDLCTCTGCKNRNDAASTGVEEDVEEEVGRGPVCVEGMEEEGNVSSAMGLMEGGDGADLEGSSYDGEGDERGMGVEVDSDGDSDEDDGGDSDCEGECTGGVDDGSVSDTSDDGEGDSDDCDDNDEDY
jgi:hypothetical protein